MLPILPKAGSILIQEKWWSRFLTASYRGCW